MATHADLGVDRSHVHGSIERAAPVGLAPYTVCASTILQPASQISWCFAFAMEISADAETHSKVRGVSNCQWLSADCVPGELHRTCEVTWCLVSLTRLVSVQ